MNPFSGASAFSLPSENLTEKLLSAVTIPYKIGIVRAALDYHKDTLSRRRPEIWNFLDKAISCQEIDSYFVCWHPYFSLINRSFIEKDPRKVEDLFVRLTAYLTNLGVIKGAWEGELDSDFSLIHNDVLLDGVNHIASDVTRGLLFSSVESGGEGESSDAYSFARSGKLRSLTISPGKTMKLLPSSVFQPISGDDFSTASAEISSKNEVDMATTIQLIESVGTKYSDWIANVIRYIVCFPQDNENSFSGSYSDLSGVVKASFLSSPEKMCEVLIHEASHQYYHIACGLGYVDDGSDTNEYYSPPVGGSRPISRILVAYHAFANITLFYRDCVSRVDALGEYARKSIERYEEYTLQLGEPLTQSTALTEVGKMLFEPLHNKLSS